MSARVRTSPKGFGDTMLVIPRPHVTAFPGFSFTEKSFKRAVKRFVVSDFSSQGKGERSSIACLGSAVA